MFVAHVAYFLLCCCFLLSKVAFVIYFLLVFALSLPVVVFLWVAFLLPSFQFTQISVMLGESLVFLKLSYFFDDSNFRVLGVSWESLCAFMIFIWAKIKVTFDLGLQ